MKGQQRLVASRVLVVGAGALGSAAATYLVAAGVGTVGLVDGDIVELSNLHRQILHDDAHVGMPKTRSAAERLQSMNPDVQIIEHTVYLTRDNTLDIFSDYDLIVNGSDNFPTRYLVNDAAVLCKKPLVDAAILRFEGQLAVYRPGHGCYRCLFPQPPAPGTVPDCALAGIFGAVAGVMGSMQAVEALKILLDMDSPESGTLMLYDALRGTWQHLAFRRDPDCAVCGVAPTITELIDYESFCGVGPATAPSSGEATTDEFAIDVEDAAQFIENPSVPVIDVRDASTYQLGHLPRAQHYLFEDLDQIDPESLTGPVLVVCQIGVRSAQATQYLRARGIEAWSLRGGSAAWRSSGKPWIAP